MDGDKRRLFLERMKASSFFQSRHQQNQQKQKQQQQQQNKSTGKLIILFKKISLDGDSCVLFVSNTCNALYKGHFPD